jgi:hypothetical protein
MLTNCPNCGATLTKDGWCNYCKTKVRLANLMDIDRETMQYRLVEILLRFKNPDGTLILMPFEGYLSEVDLNFPTIDIESRYGFSEPEIRLELDGHICDLPKWELKEANNMEDK